MQLHTRGLPAPRASGRASLRSRTAPAAGEGAARGTPGAVVRQGGGGAAAALPVTAAERKLLVPRPPRAARAARPAPLPARCPRRGNRSGNSGNIGNSGGMAAELRFRLADTLQVVARRNEKSGVELSRFLAKQVGSGRRSAAAPGCPSCPRPGASRWGRCGAKGAPRSAPPVPPCPPGSFVCARPSGSRRELIPALPSLALPLPDAVSCLPRPSQGCAGAAHEENPASWYLPIALRPADKILDIFHVP